MSLEDRIKENTEALTALREVIQQALSMRPPEEKPEPKPVPKTEEKAPEPKSEPKAEPQQKEPEIKKEEPAPETKPEPKPAPAPVDLKALRISLAPKIKALYSKDMNLGKQLLDKFGVKNLSALSDDQLPGFAQEIDRALQGN